MCGGHHDPGRRRRPAETTRVFFNEAMKLAFDRAFWR
jgi:hypothetical protein